MDERYADLVLGTQGLLRTLNTPLDFTHLSPSRSLDLIESVQNSLAEDLRRVSRFFEQPEEEIRKFFGLAQNTPQTSPNVSAGSPTSSPGVILPRTSRVLAEDHTDFSSSHLDSCENDSDSDGQDFVMVEAPSPSLPTSPPRAASQATDHRYQRRSQQLSAPTSEKEPQINATNDEEGNDEGGSDGAGSDGAGSDGAGSDGADNDGAGSEKEGSVKE